MASSCAACLSCLLPVAALAASACITLPPGTRPSFEPRFGLGPARQCLPAAHGCLPAAVNCSSSNEVATIAITAVNMSCVKKHCMSPLFCCILHACHFIISPVIIHPSSLLQANCRNSHRPFAVLLKNFDERPFEAFPNPFCPRIMLMLPCIPIGASLLLANLMGPHADEVQVPVLE